jgi:DNA-binding SARP family transcriptional activator
MRYELLGPLRVLDGDVAVEINTQKTQVLLAALLIRADQVVTADHLITEIWGDTPPNRANAGLHVYVSQLRKTLNLVGNPIVTRPPGYMLRLDSAECDFHTFLRLTNAGRECAREGRWENAISCLQRALALWRGSAIDSGPRGPIVEAFVAWLNEARRQCMELLVDMYLRLGRLRELIGCFCSLSAGHPLQDDYYRQLMTALYRSKYQYSASRVYRLARDRLRRQQEPQAHRTRRYVERGHLVVNRPPIRRRARLW